MLRDLQRQIIANRKRRGWPSAHDLSKTTGGFMEEGGEFEKARRKGNREAMVDALGDVMVFCLGAFEILDVDGHEVVRKIVKANDNRKYDEGDHH